MDLGLLKEVEWWGSQGAGGMEGELFPAQKTCSKKRDVSKQKFRLEHKFRFNVHR